MFDEELAFELKKPVWLGLLNEIELYPPKLDDVGSGIKRENRVERTAQVVSTNSGEDHANLFGRLTSL